MLPPPKVPYPVYDRLPVQIGKTPYARFDGNDYSVPHKFVRRTLLIEATLEVVQIIDGIEVVAKHVRCFEKGKQIEAAEHIDGLVKEKHNASRARGMNRILNVAPSSKSFLNWLPNVDTIWVGLRSF